MAAKKTTPAQPFRFRMYSSYVTDDLHKVPTMRETKSSTGLVTYGEGNNYPDYLIELLNRSSKHNAIITHKVNHLMGQGLMAKEKAGNVNDMAILNDWLNDANPIETWHELLYKMAHDYELFNGFALELLYNIHGQLSAVYHLPFNYIRANVTGTEYYYGTRWERNRSDIKDAEKLLRYNPNEEPSDLKGAKRIFYYKEYRPGLGVYPLPDYIGCIVSIETDVEIANFHLNNIKTQFWAAS